MVAESGTYSTFESQGVRGFIHSPDASAKRGLVLTHGAGANCTAPLLIAVANALAAVGVTVLRCDLPFRQQKPKGPPHPGGAAADRAGLKSAVLALRQIAPGEIYLGGHSYGGRQASMLAAEDPDELRGLLLLSYPLHPPNKPDQLRTQHLPKLKTPSVFVQGANDPFGSTDEMIQALSLIPATTKLITIEGAGHDLKGGRFDIGAITRALLD
jgi:predicted alpha/beta-hydrolase family hydrolase